MRVLFIIGFALVLSACATAVKEGKSVSASPANSEHLSKCDMLGQVTVKANTMKVWHADEAVIEIKNRLRDEAAIRFPNADTVSYPDLSSGVWFNPEITGVAFRCF